MLFGSVFLFIILLFLFVLPARLIVFVSYGGRQLLLKCSVRPCFGMVGVRIQYDDGRIRFTLMVGMWTLGSFSFPWIEKKRGNLIDKKLGEKENSWVLQNSLREWLDNLLFVYGFARRFGPSVRLFFKRLVLGIGFQRFICRVVLGLSNPETTGKVFGYALTLSNMLGPRVELEVVPDFDRVQVKGEIELEVSIYFYQVLWAVLCILIKAMMVLAVDILKSLWEKMGQLWNYRREFKHRI